MNFRKNKKNGENKRESNLLILIYNFVKLNFLCRVNIKRWIFYYCYCINESMSLDN